ncbi:MAG: hypothetical protein PUD59_04570 [bacterium]|nr:hypothetical protein [bacterium]
MPEYNEDLYIDEDYRKPHLIRLLLVIMLITVTLVLIISCRMNKKDSNAYLKNLSVENENIFPKFDRNVYNYSLNTNKDSVKILCVSSSSKAETIGCNKELKVDSSFNYSIVVNAENGNKKTYVINIVKNYEENSTIIEKEIDNEESANNSDGNLSIEKKYDQLLKNDLIINSVTGNSAKWTTSVTLKINASSSNDLKYSFDGGKTYSSSDTKRFNSNQTVSILVKDNYGNTKSRSIKISKIDSTKPSVIINSSNKTNKSVLLTADVSPKNTNSGYIYEWYKDDLKVSSNSSLEVFKSGNYKVKVTTGAGNSSTSSIYSFTVINVACPKLEVINETGKSVSEKTWVESPIYFKVTPSSETVSFDIYYNEPNNFNNLVENYNYFNTLQGKLKLRIVNSGIRKAKFVVRDKYGNSNTCYSGTYYIK